MERIVGDSVATICESERVLRKQRERERIERVWEREA
jgi:hypothetical protein